MPFNFLHHHAEDEHAMAMHHHEKEATHHCELDEHFCQPFSNDCAHEQHIEKSIVKCFGCEFNFIKHFTPAAFALVYNEPVTYKYYSCIKPEQLRKALIILSNKGPPALT